MSDKVSMGAFRFFDLPTELRLMVYEEYFTTKISNKEIVITESENKFAHQGYHTCDFDTGDTSIVLVGRTLPSSILQTCSQIQNEAQEIFNEEVKRNITSLAPQITLRDPCPKIIQNLFHVFQSLHLAYRYMRNLRANGTNQVAEPAHLLKIISEGLVLNFRKAPTLAAADMNIMAIWAAQGAYQIMGRGNKVMHIRLEWTDSTSAADRVAGGEIVVELGQIMGMAVELQ